MLIFHKGHTDTIQVYSVTVMTHVKALEAGHSSQGTSEPITPAAILDDRKSLLITFLFFKMAASGHFGSPICAKKQ